MRRIGFVLVAVAVLVLAQWNGGAWDSGSSGASEENVKTWISESIAAHPAPLSESASVAANSHTLQGKDTTALWNAKTLQGKDTADLWNAKTLQGYDSTDYFARMGDSAAAHEGSGTDQQARDSAAQALTEARRDSVRIDGKLATNGKAADADHSDSAEVAASAHSVVTGDSVPVSIRDTVKGYVKFNAVGDSAWSYWLIWHGNVGPYHSVGVHETCATNENLSINFGVGGGNVHSVVVGATLDTLTLTNGADGGRYLVTVLGNAAATLVWDSDASAIWWPDSAAPTRSGICNVFSFIYNGEQDVYIGAAGTNFGPP